MSPHTSLPTRRSGVITDTTHRPRPPGGSARAAAALSMLLIVAACGGEESPGSGEEQLKIAVSGHPIAAQSVPYLAALENGCFEDQGLAIEEIVGSGGGGDTVRNVLTGGLAFGDVSTVAAVQAFNAGAPIVIIGGANQALSPVKYVATAGSDVDSIEDLEGKDVGFTSPGSVTEAVLRLALSRAGVDATTINARATGGIGEGLTALEGGAIDAAATVEPTLASDPSPYQVVFSASDFIEQFQTSVIVADGDFVEENPEVVRDFLAARACGVEAITKDPRSAAEVWAKELRMEPDVVEGVVEEALSVDEYAVGLSAAGLKTVEESMLQLGQLEDGEDIPWSELINQDFLPEGTDLIDPNKV